jgi:hypothetical protein
MAQILQDLRCIEVFVSKLAYALNFYVVVCIVLRTFEIANAYKEDIFC